ncbi:restriction endonuclease [Pedobacter fastidiosus]
MKEYLQKTGDIHSLGISTSLVNNLLQENINFSPEQIARRIHKEKKLPIEISRAMANIGYERCDESCIIPSSKKWDKASKLSDLFNCEINSENENIFLEQKFLDYLAVNGHEIETIHWRNFERFCAEYFRREGYKVILGPGSNDGGVDIRVFSDTSKTTAPHMLIQCKRYKAENKVSIETVKSFYTDVLFENATTGLIATSSYIAPGGKSICDTRGYNLKFAEAENIRNWGRNMWKYSKPEQNLNR